MEKTQSIERLVRDIDANKSHLTGTSNGNLLTIMSIDCKKPKQAL